MALADDLWIAEGEMDHDLQGDMITSRRLNECFAESGHYTDSEFLHVEGNDSGDIATSDDLPDIWEFLNELCLEEMRRGLAPLDDMSTDQKEILLRIALAAKLWVGQGRLDPTVQAGMIKTGQLDDCMLAVH